MTRLSTEEEKRRALLEQSLKDLQANDPEKLLKQLTLQAGRVRILIGHLKGIESALGEKAVTDMFSLRADGRRKAEEAKRLREATFPKGLLAGTGGDQWKVLWDSARQFSEQQAYPGKAFPVVDDRAAMAVRKRIGHVKNEWQAVDKLFRDGHQDQYEKEAKNLYGLLREAWERGLEEVLLGGVVERYRPGVQTQQIIAIADITEEDCKAVEKGMAKCSAWLRGHDQSAAALAPVPKPAELTADIEELDNWVKAINKRRGK